ncbi:D-isomer specific 2-hydroxyacid dehydrogenase family protein [Anaerosporobacter sp.]
MKLFVYSMREFDEKPFFDKYSSQYEIEYDYTTQTPSLSNVELAKGYDVIDIITTTIDRELLDKFHEIGVQCITTRTIGFDHIDIEYAKKIGIGVTNVTYSPSSVADYTIMMMLMGLRKIKHILERAAIQDFTLKGKIGRELPNCTVGIVGTGKIGSTVVKHLSGFGCKILMYDIYEKNEVKQFGNYVSLDKLIRESDIISLHIPATKDNYHLINADTIREMKDGVSIINCARGSLIDSQALIDGIESGKIGFAGLDVVEHEKGLYYFNKVGERLNNPKLTRLCSYSNVVVSPHTAFYTEEAVSDMVENSIIGAISFVNGLKKNLDV